jgi:TetR/AcrR family transcriptional repressor of nem operon
MSPRPADPRVRQGLLEAARDLFLAKGFAATGIDEICTVAGVTKGALFHHFENKDALGAEVLAEWARAGFEVYSRAPFLKETSAVARILGYVDFTIELSSVAPIGCMIGTFAQEISSSHPPLRALCEGAFRDWSAGVAAMLEQARRETKTASHFDSASVAKHFVAVFEGAQILAKAHQSRDVVAEHLRHFRHYLEHLLGVDFARTPGRKRGPRKRRAP